MIVAVVALIIAATVVLCLVRLPRPLRIAVAGVDLIAAAIVFAASRQERFR
jgi:hypothetical protein